MKRVSNTDAFVQAQRFVLFPRPRSKTSITLRSISVYGLRPMKRVSNTDAFVQAQRICITASFRTAHGQR